MRTAVAALASLVPALASADTRPPPPADVALHVTAGQDLARTGDYRGAIREFEAADAVLPRASHACLIGLAEQRRHEPGQAEVRFAQCRARATPDDSLPSWLAASERDLAVELGKLAPVAITIDPPAADALLALDGWDAPFLPRTIHLAPGRYHLVARAPGQPTTTLDLEVTGATAQQVTVRFGAEPVAAAPPTTAPPPPPPLPVAMPPPREHHAARYWLGAGAAAIVAAGIVDVTAVRSTYNTLNATQTDPDYNSKHGAYAAARDVTLGLLVGGAISLAVGAVLHHSEAAPPRVGAIAQHGGGLLTLEWSR